MFALDARLQQDTICLGDYPFCRLLLMNDVQYPWFILVPRREDISELFQLDAGEQAQLWRAQPTQVVTRLPQAPRDEREREKVGSLMGMLGRLRERLIA